MSGSRSRTVLFLQGPPSGFWSELAGAFEAAGHRTLRVNLHGGDRLFWHRPKALNFRGRLKSWPSWLAAVCRREQVTDILYYADRLPYHVDAQAVAKDLGIRAYAIEHGYLRPHWLTLERGGMGAYSHFPDDPAVIRAAAEGLPGLAPESFPHRFSTEASREIFYGTAIHGILRVGYPFYRSDRYRHPWLEYLAWLPKIFRVKSREIQAKATAERLWSSGTPYHLIALQLQSDYQIRANSPYLHIRDMVDQVIASFARSADPAGHLLFKQHPLDNDLESWPTVVARTAARHGIADRVSVIDGGPLHDLLQRSRGAVVINSTVGLHSVQMGVPTKLLGAALFDIAGITHQGRLDRFWTEPEPVDLTLVDCLVRLMAASIQVQGSFYNPDGRRVAIAEIVRRVTADLVNEPGAFVSVPPRLEAARRMGVPLAFGRGANSG